MTNISTQFKPGQSGNPNGRPKREWTWSGLLEEVGEEIETKSQKKFKDLVSKKLWIKAANGDLMAIKEIFNRMDGMPIQQTDLTSGGDKIQTIDVEELLEKVYGTKDTNEGSGELSENS